MTSTDSVRPTATSAAPTARKPRKVFLLVGAVLAVALGIGLFTNLGTSPASGPPHAGGAVPSFSAPRLNGPGAVQVPSDGGSGGTPAVLLFFANWCAVCHSELPSLAAAVRHQDEAKGALSSIRVIGVDSGDTRGDAVGFVRASRVTFPVGYDPNDDVVNGDFYFDGDPYAVFVKGDGTIADIVGGPITATRFTALERKLIPTGS